MGKLAENCSGQDVRVRRKSTGEAYTGTCIHDTRAMSGPVDDTPGEGIEIKWSEGQGGGGAVWTLFLPASDIDERSPADDPSIDPAGETTTFGFGVLGFNFITPNPAP